MKCSVHEDTVLPVTDQVEVSVCVVKDLHVLSGDEGGVTHVDVHVPSGGTVSTDDQPVLPHQVLELLPLEFGDGSLHFVIAGRKVGG